MRQPSARSGSGALVVALVLVGVSGCASGGAAGITGSVTDRTTAPAAATASAGAVDLGPAGAGWLAGDRITVESSSYDAATGVVTLSTSVENTATEESFEADITDFLLLDTGSGAPVAASSVSSVAVAGATTDIDIEFSLAPGGAVDLASAVLELGGPGYATWSVPLDGTDAEGTEPREVAMSGTADAGGLLFTVTRAQVLPWACEDADDLGPGASGRVWYEPGADDEAAVVLWGDILETQSIVGGDTTTTTLSLTGPDGVASPQIGTVNTVFDLNEGIRDFPLCFTVRTPVSGTYTLTWNSYRQATAQLAVTIPEE